ncbi:MAG: hypothetical protein LBI84_00180, partial [Propionibacteriaceae bacterium]|nr:hypothetical protein [Propionibacteriaceae bacterium]
DLDGQKAYQLTDQGRAAAGELAGEPWASEQPQWNHPGNEWQAVWKELRGLGKALKVVVPEATADQLDTIAADVAALKRKVFAILAEPPATPPADPAE